RLVRRHRTGTRPPVARRVGRDEFHFLASLGRQGVRVCLSKQAVPTPGIARVTPFRSPCSDPLDARISLIRPDSTIFSKHFFSCNFSFRVTIFFLLTIM